MFILSIYLTGTLTGSLVKEKELKMISQSDTHVIRDDQGQAVFSGTVEQLKPLLDALHAQDYWQYHIEPMSIKIKFGEYHD